MEAVAVLVMERGAAEATLIRAALARCTEVQVVESLTEPSAQIALAIAGAKALAQAGDELKELQARGIPVVAVASGLSQKARKRALAAGVREIHERPRDWQPYAQLVESLVARFTRTGSPPHRGPTS
jgi:ABC-type sugar transport system substrate-binding protein